jgi:hypothetical protein
VNIERYTSARNIPDDSWTTHWKAIGRDELILFIHEFHLEKDTSPRFPKINVRPRKPDIFWHFEYLRHRYHDAGPVPIFGKFRLSLPANTKEMATATGILRLTLTHMVKKSIRQVNLRKR